MSELVFADLSLWSKRCAPIRMQPAIPVIAILHDHFEVPSMVICSACSIESMCVSGSTENVVLRGRQPETRTPIHTYELGVGNCGRT